MFCLEKTLYCDELARRFDKAIEGILIAMLAFMPLAYGVVEAWSEAVVLALAAALSVCFLLKGIVTGRVRLTWTWAYIPVAAFLAVVVLHLIPMPPAWVGVLSPHTVTEKTMLLADLPAGRDVLSTMTLSFYPWATRHDLRLVLAGVAVFVVVINTWRRPDQIMRLLGAITAIGAGVAVLALLQNVAGNGKIYWCVCSPHGTAHSGPFVNHSHYAQFMNLSVGAALAFTFVKVHQKFMRRKLIPKVVVDYLGSPAARLTWAAALAAALGMASVFMSMSRGGMISMLVAGATMVLILSSRKALGSSGWLIGVLALIAFICVLAAGFDAVYDRLGSLRELDRAEGGRWQIVKDIAVAWTQFPLLGTGLGTHQVVYPMFDRSTVVALATHAENEYAQAAEETGAVGLLALVALGGLLWWDYVHIIRAGRAPIHSAAYGLGFGLMAVMVHSLSDFGQHLPANGILSIVFCALLIRLRHIRSGGDASASEMFLEGRGIRRYGIAGLVVLAGIWGWVLLDADAARRSERHWRQARAAEADLTARDWQGTNDQYIDLIGHAQAAADLQPDNVIYRYWLPVYRWRSLSRLVDPNTRALPPEGRDYVVRIVGELNEARACCPTYGATWSVLGQLERLVLDRPEGEVHIRTGYRLAPCDPIASLLAGTLDVEAGRVEAAFAKLQRAVELDAGYFGDVAGLLIDDLERPDLALEVAGESPKLAGQLVHLLEGQTEFAEAVDRKLLSLLEEKCREDEMSAYWHAMLGGVLRRQGDPERAIASYKRALNLDPGQVRWRLHLAQLLWRQGRVAEALYEADMCLQLSPGLKAANVLIEELSDAETSGLPDSETNSEPGDEGGKYSMGARGLGISPE